MTGCCLVGNFPLFSGQWTVQQLKIEFFEWDLEENGSLWKIYIFYGKSDFKNSNWNGKVKISSFWFFYFFVKIGQKWAIQKFYRRCKGVLVTVEDCGHGPVGGCCSKLWVGVTYNQTGKSCFKIRPAGPDFYGLWNKRNNDGAGGGCVQCSEVRAGDCSGYLRTAPPQVHLLHSGDPEGIHQEWENITWGIMDPVGLGSSWVIW